VILDIDPKVDYAFKHLFGRNSTRPLLIDLLNHILNREPGRRIQDLELLNPFNPKESLDDKLSILDIKARDQSGQQINVEMQMLLSAFFKSRIIYYQTKFHQQQLHEGEDYRVLKPTISIVFLNQVLFPEVADYHLRFRVLEERHHFPFTDDLELHTLELPKFLKREADLTSGLDLWLYFLRHAEKIDSDAIPKILDQSPIPRAVEELKMLTQTDLERERYEARRKAQLDYNSGLIAARKEGEEKGRMEGKEEGRKEGEEKGRMEGKEEGRSEAERIAAIRLIHLCERILQRSVYSKEELDRLSLSELTRLGNDLEAELLKHQ
jgi:predicted transposase/invertase (TIGR01784 family)